MNMMTVKLAVVAACLACAMASPVPQAGQEILGFDDEVDFVGAAQLDGVETSFSAGPESDLNAVGARGDPEYYYDSEIEPTDVVTFTDYANEDSKVETRFVRSITGPRGSGKQRRRQMKIGGSRQRNTKH